MCGIYARGPIGRPDVPYEHLLTDDEKKELDILFNKISDREFQEAIKKYESNLEREKFLCSELDDLLMFALHANADDLSEFNQNRMKKLVDRLKLVIQGRGD